MIYQGSTQVLDSGPVYDSTIAGGRVGVFQFGAFPMIWTYLEVNCLEHHNKGLYLDGVDDFIALGDIPTLEMEERYRYHLSRDARNRALGLPTRSDTNLPLQSQKMARGWKFWI